MHNSSVYNPLNHYWIRENGMVYSSKAMADLNTDDESYKNWLEASNYPTAYPKDENGNECEKELQKVLAAYGLKAYPDSESVLAKLRIGEIKAELKKLDIKKVRPMAVIQEWALKDINEKNELSIEQEEEVLNTLSNKSDELREEMHILEAFLSHV